MKALRSVPAPAKLNLFLHVLGRRPDGYHELESVFRFIGLYDYLDFELTTDGSIQRINDVVNLPQQSDLTIRAARLLQQTTNTGYGANISYQKNLPAGGGVGGGSSDAATTLIALNHLWQTGLSRQELLNLGGQLGADVPVFIYGQSAFATGIGDNLNPVTLADNAYLLIKPAATVATTRIFSAPDLTRDSESVKISSFTDWQSDHDTLFGRNDLQETVFRLEPVIAKTHDFLLGFGLDTRMTGSGSCLFAEFADFDHAMMQYQQIISKIGNQANLIENIWVCPGLSDHPLRDWLPD